MSGRRGCGGGDSGEAVVEVVMGVMIVKVVVEVIVGGGT